METFSVTAIAHVVSPRAEPVDDDWAGVESTIEIAADYGPDALRGIADFSHIEVVYLFHLVDRASIASGARCPRGNTDWPEVGIFAQRAKARPNRLGVSYCELLGVEGTTLRVREPAWAEELMADYF